MTARRTIRWARVEYQPNLHHPANPIPLGVVAEESRGDRWELVIIGRQPRGAIPGLQLENAWGPFKSTVVGWAELMAKGARELAEENASRGPLLDDLARRWNLNVYLQQPETKIVHSAVDLAKYAKRWYEQYVGEPLPVLQAPARKKGTSSHHGSMRPWLSIANQIQGVALFGKAQAIAQG